MSITRGEVEQVARLAKLALGAGPTVVRYLPPLVITEQQVRRVIEATARALA